MISTSRSSDFQISGSAISSHKNIQPYILEEAKELKQYIYYLNAENSSCGETLERFGVVYTPSIIIIDDGKVRVYDDFGVNEIRDILLESTITIKDWSNSFSFISYEELMKKMNGNVDFFLCIGREDCRDCRSFNPIIKEYVAEPNGVGIYYFDLKVFRDKAMMKNASSADIEFYNSIKNTFNIEWVPSVYHIRNGEIVSKYEYLDEQYYLIEKAEKKEEIEQGFVNRFYEWIEEEKKSSR